MNTVKKYKSRNFAIGFAIGIPIGTPIGLVLGNLALGPAAGLVIGLILGWAFNARDKNRKEGETASHTNKNKIWIYTLIFGIILLVETIILINIMGS